MAVTYHCSRIHNSTTTGHSQLVRSLERILEEANLSGELVLTNRKLKDFPKAATKYNLSDTVIADLSRNRFCEIPEEVTTFSFLETLLLYHNTIRHIPESVKYLTLLTYLDLRSNQLSTLPKELCLMPLQVLLVSNNRLVSLPDELGRMDKLTDLDASYNQLTALPARVSELRNLKSLTLRNNQILFLPREMACLTLVSLDVSNNRITSLPLEIRLMSSLVEFKLGNNPLTSPPASLCVRGLVHIFKFLETQASKEEKGCRAGGNYDGYTTLRRAPKQNAGSIFECTKNQRYQGDSGYSTCDGMDKRWLPNKNSKNDFISTRKVLPHSTVNNIVFDTDTISDEIISKPTVPSETQQKKKHPIECSLSQENQPNGDVIIHSQTSSTSSGSSPEDDMINENLPFIDKDNKHLGNIQTYREYKEALKQQRNQEISSLYKAKSNALYDMKEDNASNSFDEQDLKYEEENINNVNVLLETVRTEDHAACVPKKPVQKVIPSRNTELMSAVLQTKSKNKTYSQHENGECFGYVKPNSPIKALGTDDISVNNNLTPTNVGVRNKLLPGMIAKQQQFLSQNKGNRSVSWNHDVPAEKLSFTMRREFDKQREETELMTQLRNIIQVRLKTILPEDIASALTDGVILCHLANYVRPRSVVSIHVPSPGVSKLTMARCRRNVDNFLEACRKIGVDEELICSSEDVVSTSNDNCSLDDEYQPPLLLSNPSSVFKTVSALLLFDPISDRESHQTHHVQEQNHQSMEEHKPPATNMQLTKKFENKVNAMPKMLAPKDQIEGETDVTKTSQFGKFLRHAKIKTFQNIKLNLTNNNSNLKFNSSGGKECLLQTIEETDADSYQIVNEKISPVVLKVNGLNTMKFKLLQIAPYNNKNIEENQTVASQCLSKNKDDVISHSRNAGKIVTKGIEFFESQSVSRCSPSNDVNVTSKSIYSIYQTTNEDGYSKNNYDDRILHNDFSVLTIILSCVFVATFILLVVFPLPD